MLTADHRRGERGRLYGNFGDADVVTVGSTAPVLSTFQVSLPPIRGFSLALYVYALHGADDTTLYEHSDRSSWFIVAAGQPSNDPSWRQLERLIRRGTRKPARWP